MTSELRRRLDRLDRPAEVLHAVGAGRDVEAVLRAHGEGQHVAGRRRRLRPGEYRHLAFPDRELHEYAKDALGLELEFDLLAIGGDRQGTKLHAQLGVLQILRAPSGVLLVFSLLRRRFERSLAVPAQRCVDLLETGKALGDVRERAPERVVVIRNVQHHQLVLHRVPDLRGDAGGVTVVQLVILAGRAVEAIQSLEVTAVTALHRALAARNEATVEIRAGAVYRRLVERSRWAVDRVPHVGRLLHRLIDLLGQGVRRAAWRGEVIEHRRQLERSLLCQRRWFRGGDLRTELGAAGVVGRLPSGEECEPTSLIKTHTATRH